MSISVDTNQGHFDIPGAYADYGTQPTNSGFSTTGVVVLVGEADAGPDYTLEANLDEDTAYGPDAESAVVSKYRSGPLVDAFKRAATPSKDPDITGAPSLIKIIKTNPSLKASWNLPKIGGGTYAPLKDKSYGKLGNLFTAQTTASVSEAAATTGSMTFIPPTGASSISIRPDGGAASLVGITAAMLPSAFVAALAGIATLAAVGGVARAAAPGAGNKIAVAVAGNVITLTSLQADGVTAQPWATQPTVGDTLVIGAASAIKGGTGQNVGAYVVTAATANTVTATKLADGAAGVAGVITAPVLIAATVATTADVEAYSPVTISRTPGVIDGIGKSLEFIRTTGTESLFFVLGSVTPAVVFSATGAPKLFTSASEYAVTLSVQRAVDGVNEALTAGGDIALQVGYLGTTATFAVNATGTTATLTATGGAGAGASPVTIDLTQMPTLADLAAYINTLDGWYAKVGSVSLSTNPPSVLDRVTANACTSTQDPIISTKPGLFPCRIKMDASAFFNAVLPSLNVMLDSPQVALAGLPDVTATRKAFAGGTRGATTQAIFQAAIDILGVVDCNFIVPLFSQDATADIALGATDSGSNYTIDSINAYVNTHCLAMSKITARKNRQAVVSKRDTWANVKLAANNLAAGRVNITFQDVMSVGTNGLAQFQPWMNAVEAAAMQAAAGPKAIFNKILNINGAVQNAKDFNSKSSTQLIEGLKAGVLMIKKDNGFRYVSDQTTYSKDSNPIWNSMQAIYAADTVSQTTAKRMEQAFVGKTLAKVSASVALAFLETIMLDMVKLGYLARSDDAQRGFRNAKVKIAGPAMQIEAEIYLATALYFVTIRFQVNQVNQTASS